MPDKLHKDLKKRLEPVADYIELIDNLQDLRQDIPSQERLEAILKHARALFCPHYKPNACIEEYGRILKINPNSPEAHHYVGKILMNNELFFQAHLLFDKGLGLETKDSDDITEDLHKKFHYDLWGLGIKLLRRGLSLKDYGYRVDELGLIFSQEQGFYLPDFNYNYFNSNSRNTRQSRDEALSFIHWNLGHVKEVENKPHKADNCPYLEYISKRFQNAS